jgi:DNA-directed RNA polymerase specialized sigma24 family protein
LPVLDVSVDLESRAVRGAMKRWRRSWWRIADDLAQEVAMELLVSAGELDATTDRAATLARLAHRACARFARWERSRSGPPLGDEASVPDRSGGPLLGAILAEEFAIPPVPSRGGFFLSMGERAALRKLMEARPGSTRAEIAAEFRALTGRPINPADLSKHRKAFGLPRTSPGLRGRSR